MKKTIPIFLKTVGVIQLIIGIIAVYYGPMEIFCFYLFSEGGRFYYEGFGVGSIWFAYLVIQNIGYYIIAALLLPIGIGHMKLRSWTLPLIRLYSWFWFISGLILISNALFLLPAAFQLDLDKNTLYIRLSIIAIFSFLTLVILPVLIMKFYNNKHVRFSFDKSPTKKHWLEKYPFPLLALLLLYIIMILILHVAMFFQGFFPFFGHVILGRQAAYLIALSVLITGFQIYGVINLQSWAWWSSLGFVALLFISTLITFPQYNIYQLILMLKLPAYEMELINKMTLFHNFHLTGLITMPLLISLGLIIYSKRFFLTGKSPK